MFVNYFVYLIFVYLFQTQQQQHTSPPRLTSQHSSAHLAAPIAQRVIPEISTPLPPFAPHSTTSNRPSTKDAVPVRSFNRRKPHILPTAAIINDRNLAMQLEAQIALLDHDHAEFKDKECRVRLISFFKFDLK